MPKYKVRKVVDSYSYYVAEIEAESEGDALDKAEQDYKYNSMTPLKWEFDGVSEFDDVQFEIDEYDDAA